VIALKIALVAASVLLASLVARRFGHAIAGLIGGLPMIAGPIIGFVLWQEPLAGAQAIVRATLICLPATIVHQVTFAWCATRWPRWHWSVALLAANAALFACGALLLALQLPMPAVLALVIAAPLLGLAAMPRLPVRAGGVTIPKLELALRVVVAMVVAAAIIESAGVAPAAVSGLLLATPITANVLPCFTLVGHGAAATVALLTGFVRGLIGFVLFFVVLHVGLGEGRVGLAFGAAWGVALIVAALMQAWGRRRAARVPAG
jgi:hypothetical protein